MCPDFGNEMCDKSHQVCDCLCKPSYTSVQQTLEELEFSRGIWTSAVNGCHDEVVSFLEQKGVHPDSFDSSGYTALHYASRNGHTTICKLLLDAGASPNVQTSSGGVTPLHRAAYCGHLHIVGLLLSRGADPEIKDADGKLPIHKSVEKGHQEVTEKLLIASPNSHTVKDNRGRLPVDCIPKDCFALKRLLDKT